MTRNQKLMLAWVAVPALLVVGWLVYDLSGVGLVFFCIFGAIGTLIAVSGDRAKDQAAAERWTLDRLRRARDRRRAQDDG